MNTKPSLRNLFSVRGLRGTELSLEDAQYILNAYLDEHAKTYYGFLAGNGEIMYGPNMHTNSTHAALLLEIGPTQVCTHENVITKYPNDYDLPVYSCRDCKVLVKPKGWSTV